VASTTVASVITAASCARAAGARHRAVSITGKTSGARRDNPRIAEHRGG
jgi:hypothetical protein